MFSLPIVLSSGCRWNIPEVTPSQYGLRRRTRLLDDDDDGLLYYYYNYYSIVVAAYRTFISRLSSLASGLIRCRRKPHAITADSEENEWR
jgi:hypothetical protein